MGMDVSLKLKDGTEYIDSTKFKVEEIVPSCVSSLVSYQTPNSIEIINFRYPFLEYTLIGYFTDFAELDNFMQMMFDSDVWDSDNNELAITHNDRTVTYNVCIKSIKPHTNIKLSEDLHYMNVQLVVSK